MFRLLLAVGAPLLLFGLIEAGLRAAGVGYQAAFVVPAPEDDAWLIDNYRFAWRFFPKALARSPQPFRIAAGKPENGLRVVVLGGSAAMGDPDPAYGLPRTLECLLRERHPERNIEVINAAVTAINSHVVLPIARDCLALEPDLFVVYMGNNEVNGPLGATAVFGETAAPLSVIRASLALKRTRAGQGLASLLQRGGTDIPANWGGMKMFLEQQITEDDPRLERVYANFESNYRDLLALAENAGIPIVFSTVAVNLADSAPFSSEAPDPAGLGHARELAAEAKWADLLRSTEALIDAAPGHAEARYLRGLAQIYTGNVDSARASFRRARDLDTLRFRADSRINAIIRSLSAKTAHFVDTEAHLATLSPDAIPGRKFFFEHVHFTPEGSYPVAKLLARNCESAVGLTSASDSWPALDQCMAELGSSPFHQRELLQELRGRLSGAPFTNQFGHAARVAELDRASLDLKTQLNGPAARDTVAAFESVIARKPDDWQARDKFAVLLDSLGALEPVVAQRRAIAELLPHNASANSELGSALNRVEKWSEAEDSLRRAIALREKHPKAWNSLGICLSRQPNRSAEAKDCFARAVTLRPDYAEALFNWGLILGNEGALREAVAQFQSAIAADSRYTPAYQSLGQALVKLKQFEPAIDAYRKLTELAPNDPNSHLNHGLACMHVNGQRPAAIQSLRTALKLDPNNTIAVRTLADIGIAP